MLDQTATTGPSGGAQLLEKLSAIKSDSLLALIALANADTRPEKIDVGVGVYRDGHGGTPILRSVKAAEQRLWEAQTTKSYLGSMGDVRFAELIRPILLGRHAANQRIMGLQTPGGCGALSLAFKLIAEARPGARVLVGTPTWPNHVPVIDAAGLEIARYGYYDRESATIRFDEMMSMLDGARRGDVVLLHGCCHNPTGADLSDDQWADVARTVAHRGLLPVIDIAYQGLGRGLEEDARGLHRVLDLSEEVIIAQSCDKNFGVYRDRVGSLFVATGSAATTRTAIDHVAQLARAMWSMPPDHGAAVVRTVLDDEALAADWHAELGEMRARINRIRSAIAGADPRLAYIGRQFGMFSMLPFDAEQVRSLRDSRAIYMADSGRFNIVGMADEAVDRFIAAVVEVLNG
ncbi:aromatic amino acid transaminase [Sphingomonas sp. LY29]|uniref:amino acid aminotransferase n=1 Tax=Sphingomonas sp. LY29 TaxID=3095341 RepID=UPI002D78D691|nr:aromatic amino acid transaminase [Sphingomonas sp. LY29]WRP25729.1 aromatic amino acid transaminase [Sphingomonas sp. LY29]